MLDIEVLDLVGWFVDCDDVQELSQAVSFEVLFGQVLEVSLGEGDVGLDSDFLVIGGDFDWLSEFACFAIDFNSLFEELCEVVGVEDFIFDGFGAVDGEGFADFSFSFFFVVFFDLGLFRGNFGSSWFCGHHNIYYKLIIKYSFSSYYLPIIISINYW